MTVAKKSQADRGKYAEGKVRAVLAGLKRAKAAFDFERQYDFRTSRGRIPPQTGDFTFYVNGLHGAMEVKEVHHAYRLPLKNYSVDQRARLKIRQLAGGLIVTPICFITDEGKLWRVPPWQYFVDNWQPASWDLRDFPTYPNAQAALESIIHEGWHPFQ